MKAIVNELDFLLSNLPAEKAAWLTERVREAIASADEEEVLSIDEIKRRMPEIAHLIGAWADVDTGEIEELPLPMAKVM